MTSQTHRKDAENRNYLEREVNNVLEPMMLEVVAQKPEN